MPKRSSTPKIPSDINQIAAYIRDSITAEHAKNPSAVELGRLGGLKGGRARAKNLSMQRRREIAINAAKARWKKKKGIN
jgi:hypothetical protein